jgi:hypothetical protein
MKRLIRAASDSNIESEIQSRIQDMVSDSDLTVKVTVSENVPKPQIVVRFDNGEGAQVDKTFFYNNPVRTFGLAYTTYGEDYLSYIHKNVDFNILKEYKLKRTRSW